MARKRVASLVLLGAILGFLAGSVTNRSAFAQQQTGSENLNPRFTIKSTGTLDGRAGGIRASFIKDNKTSECWLWVNESGAGSALSPAKDLSCN